MSDTKHLLVARVPRFPQHGPKGIVCQPEIMGTKPEVVAGWGTRATRCPVGNGGPRIATASTPSSFALLGCFVCLAGGVCGERRHCRGS